MKLNLCWKCSQAKTTATATLMGRTTNRRIRELDSTQLNSTSKDSASVRARLHFTKENELEKKVIKKTAAVAKVHKKWRYQPD